MGMTRQWLSATTCIGISLKPFPLSYKDTPPHASSNTTYIDNAMAKNNIREAYFNLACKGSKMDWTLRIKMVAIMNALPYYHLSCKRLQQRASIDNAFPMSKNAAGRFCFLVCYQYQLKDKTHTHKCETYRKPWRCWKPFNIFLKWCNSLFIAKWCLKAYSPPSQSLPLI